MRRTRSTLPHRPPTRSRRRAAALGGLALAVASFAPVAIHAGLPGPLFVYEGTRDWDLLGSAVSSAGDPSGDGAPDLLIGAYAADGVAGRDAGRVLVASGASGKQILVLEGDAAGDWFGYAVAAASDLDGDDFDDLLVGAPRADGAGGTDCGRLHVISGRTAAELFTVDGELPGDGFGSAVALTGDVDGDTVADLVVGAPFADPAAGPDAGRVYVLSGADGSVVRTLDGQATDDRFGTAVCAAHDVDGDGVRDVVAGAPGHDTAGANAGRVTVHSGADGTLVHLLDGAAPGDGFGAAVRALRDLDGDQRAELAVGAPLADGAAGTDAGSVAVFHGADASLRFRLEGTASSAWFGSAIASAGDVDGDAVPDLAAGAPRFEGARGRASGRVAIHSGADGREIRSLAGDSPFERFGSAVAGVGDLDGDGRGDLLAGAPFGSPADRTGAGAARVVFNPEAFPCLAGTVNAQGDGGVTPILFVNGSTGGGLARVFASADGPLDVALERPPAGGPGRFVVHANLGAPTAGTLTGLPFGIGTACFPMILTQGGDPDAVWNNVGKVSLVGASVYFDGTSIPDPDRAPANVLSLPGGDPANLPPGATVTFQAIAVDPASASQKSASLSNAVIVEIF